MNQKDLSILRDIVQDETAEKLWDDALEHCDVEGLTTDQLGDLVYQLTARRLVEALREPGVSPGIFNAALRFLKDNDITGIPIPGSAHDQLLERLGRDLPFMRRTGTDDC